jgi:hypothetical protein
MAGLTDEERAEYDAERAALEALVYQTTGRKL